MKEKYIGKKVLITTQNWFYAPDGNTYRGIWGLLKNIVKVDELLGFTPNRPNTNWVYEIGDAVISGCQVNYILLCPEKPNAEGTTMWEKDQTYKTPNQIYITDGL